MIWTLADLLRTFGPLPATRVRHGPPPGEATEKDLLELAEGKKILCELVDGILLEKAMGFYEAYIALLIGHQLVDFAKKHDLGIVLGADGMMRLAPGLVRIPDVSFIGWERLSNRQIPRMPIPDLAPHLAVEVLSEGNTTQEMDRKLQEYFQYGVELVWYVDPADRSITVYNAPDQSRRLEFEDTLTGGDVLPEFSLSVRTLFEDADPPNQQDA